MVFVIIKARMEATRLFAMSREMSFLSTVLIRTNLSDLSAIMGVVRVVN